MGRKKLLVIDDKTWYLAELQKAGYRILKAGDGLDAIRLISDARRTGKDFDLIIADMMLLNLSSVPALINNMKDRDISIPVCAVSAYRSNEENMELLYAGCKAFISDPFEPASLLEFVDDILNRPLPKSL
jgi:DNA-binding response OmpR family regulator